MKSFRNSLRLLGGSFPLRPRSARRAVPPLALALAVLALGACATRGVVKSGLSAPYSPGLTLTLLSWRDGEAVYAGHAARGRWLTADVRVDYDGNAQFAELPVPAVRLIWEGPGGARGEATPQWVYDPTPGAGGAAARETLRVRISNRFILAFDLPEAAVPVSIEIGDKTLPLDQPAPNP